MFSNVKLNNIKTLRFKQVKDEFQRVLNEKKFMVLATSFKRKVTARTVSCVYDGLKILFQTLNSSVKVQQIIQNPNVAMAIDDISIEGIAKILGHPLNSNNRKFTEIFKEIHPNAFEAYSNAPDEVVIEVRPIKINRWKYEEGAPIQDFLDLKSNNAYRKIY